MVFLITLILLGDLGAAFLVFLMVALTDVAILAAFVVRGLSIEFISALVLVLAVGFSVDYSAHIAHAFIHSDGVTGDDRARDALAKIGKSVICGGFSTWLAVVLLPFSNSYLFKEVIFWSMTFTVGFGMFHGMLVLPVLLSLIHDGRQWWCGAQYPIDRGWGEVAGAKSTTKRSTTQTML
jgi:multidrug efflux pump subunit AcrB